MSHPRRPRSRIGDALDSDELTVFKYIASGLTAAQTARLMSLTQSEVELRMTRVRYKLGGGNTVTTVRVAIARGIIPVEFTPPSRPVDPATPPLFPE